MVPPVGFELATNGIQFYAVANLDKTSLKQHLQYFLYYAPSANMKGHAMPQ